MMLFNLAIFCVTTSNLPWFMYLTLYVLCNIVLTASDFTFMTRYIRSWVLFPLWLSLFILSGAIRNCPPLFPSSILDTFWPGGLIFWCHIFLPFHTVLGVSWLEYWSGLPFPPPVEHVLSELPTMTHLFWVTLHSRAHSFIELHKPLRHDKAVIRSATSLVHWQVPSGHSKAHMKPIKSTWAQVDQARVWEDLWMINICLIIPLSPVKSSKK